MCISLDQNMIIAREGIVSGVLTPAISYESFWTVASVLECLALESMRSMLKEIGRIYKEKITRYTLSLSSFLLIMFIQNPQI